MKKFLFLFIFVSFNSVVFSQLNLDLFVGAANYEGDMQSSFFTFSQPCLAVGAGVSYPVSNKLFIRGGITIASLSADDKKNPKVYFRNLNFKTYLQEFNLSAEYYLLDPDVAKLSPYVFAGVAVYHFNPYTEDTSGTAYYLRPLSTEGQGFYLDRKPYNLTQFAIPFGGGIKYALNDKIKIGIEVGLRKLFTDYLDDVSTTYVDPNLLLTNRGAKAVELAFRGGEIDNTATYPVVLTKRGEPKNKDWYYFTGITLSYQLSSRGETGGSNWSRKKSKKLGCPPKVN